MRAFIDLHHRSIRVVLPKLLHYVLTDIAVPLLDGTSYLQLILGWNSRHLPSLSKKIQDKLRNVPSGDGDMLDGTTNDISICNRNDVRYTIAAIDDCACEDLICLLA
jgi:hypothetical protein